MNLGLEAHHAFPKGSSREITHYMLSNLCSLCVPCHRYAQTDGAEEFHKFWKGEIGVEDYGVLEKLSKVGPKMDLKMYDDLIRLYSSSV